MTSLFSRHSRCGWLVAVLACLVATGCGAGDDGGVKTYKVAAPDDKVKPDDKKVPTGPGHVPADAGAAKIRFLGAVIPIGGENNYFVRFRGPIEQIDQHEKGFDAILTSIRVPGDGGKPISWTVPPGWKEVPNPPQAAGFRVVTFKSADDTSPELYISTPTSGSLLSNVNRWRTDFVGIPGVTEADLPSVTKEVQLGATKAYRVDFRGPGGKGGMGGPPFMK